ncbi:transmembrane 214, partial [Pelobates cultripes]
DLAGYLNDKLQAPRSEQTLNLHFHDHSFCLLSKKLSDIIQSLGAKANDVPKIFVDHYISLMLQELDKPKGESLYDYRNCIQAVLLDKPKTVTANLKKYLEKPMKCLKSMWSVGKTGLTDLTECCLR